MAFLFSISFIFCSVLVSSLTYCLSVENFEGAKIVGPTFANFCSSHGIARSRKISQYISAYRARSLPPSGTSSLTKIACIICKGFDPSCFITSTTTTSTTTTTTTTIPPSTTSTTTSTTTPPTTTTPAAE